MPKSLKKSKYKSVVIKKKRYYFYKITWLDITGDSGHADLHSAIGFMPSEMITHAYLLNKDKKNIRTFASYEVNDELFSDRNVFPKGCIVRMEKINENKKFNYDGRSRPANDLYSANFNRIFNPTLTKNMPNVKWDQLPPRKGPDSNGIQASYKQVGTNKKVSKKII